MVLRHLLPALAILPWSLFVPASGAFAATVPEVVPVRVYVSAGLESPAQAAAMKVASATLDAAGVAVAWRGCGGNTGASACATAPADGELILRIVGSSPAIDSGQSHAARLRAPAGLPLGDAFVDVRSHSGVLATVYVDRVLLLARDAGVETALLLGRAIAHEIGHLLLASTRHGRYGLMRPIWSSEELRRGRPADWKFTREEVAAIRTRLEAARIARHVRY